MPPLEPETSANPSDDARADVAAALASLKSPEPSGESADVQSEAVQSSSASDASQAQPTARSRDEHGRFAPKAGEQPVQTSDETTSQASAPQPSTAAVNAPKTWSDEEKAELSKASPVLQKAVERRNAEIEAGAQKWSQEKRVYEETLAPLRQAARQRNMNEGEAIRKLLLAQEYLERDAETAIRWLAKSHNVDLAKLASGAAASPSPIPAATPSPAPAADQIAALVDQRIAPIAQHFERQQQAETNREIETFKASLPVGQNFFDDVKTDVGHILLTAVQMGREMSLQQAYDQAIWANPDTRAKMIAAQTAAASREAQDRAAAEKARKGAGLGLNGSPNGKVIPPAQDYATVEDAARAAFVQHSRAH